ncbi:MAG: hypothetical protein ACQUHE_07365 [Bacteroidia bacterium]
MKLNHWLYIWLLAPIAACQNNSSTKIDQEHATSVATVQNCYTYVKNRDTASLTTMVSGHIVTGELNYRLYEKDANTGTIKGEMIGDTLVADYTFLSEGKQSVRQVAFLEKNGSLKEGFGEVVEANGRMVFKDISTLKFGETTEFLKTDCK